MTYAIVMAGGKGTRFWPVSTPEHPKQLLRLFDNRSMIELTIDRISPLISREKQRIITVADQAEAISACVPHLDRDAYIIEPFARNTAPCIGLAAVHLMRMDESAIMAVLPADHRVDDVESFQRTLQTAISFVEETDAIVTLGIKPTRPETGYGYIQYEQEEFRPGIHRVVTFAEKPNRDTAIRFLETGEFLWNSGIFVWSAQRILSEIEEYLPELFAALMEIRYAFGEPDEEERIRRAYQSIKSISIDYGVMERTRNAYVVPGEFGWSDVGSWDEVYRISQKDHDDNVLKGPVVTLDTRNSYIVSENGNPLAVIGLTDVVIVHTEQGTLVCPRERVQEVKEVAEQIFRGRVFGSQNTQG